MRIRALLLAVGVLSAAVATGGVPVLLSDNRAGAETSAVVFRFADARIDEASGLALGIRSPGVVYVQNDSGDSARFFAVDSATGRTLAVCSVPGARNLDWEDLATARDSRGVPSVWLGDIGDNDEVRTSITVYRVDEPAVADGAGSAASAELDTVRPDVWRLRYPDGPHNAEALFVDPRSHRGYVVTKSVFGQSEVFELPSTPSATSVQVLSRVGSIDFDFTGTPGGPNLVGQLTATGASMSADGDRLVVRTYTDAYLWTVSGSDVAGALRGKPTRTPLPAQPLGEGVAFGGRGLLIDTEGAGTAVQTLALPAKPQPPAKPSAAGTPSASTSSAITSSAETPAASPSSTGSPAKSEHRSAAATGAASGEHGGSGVSWSLAGCALAAAVLAGWGFRRVRRRH